MSDQEDEIKISIEDIHEMPDASVWKKLSPKTRTLILDKLGLLDRTANGTSVILPAHPDQSRSSETKI